MKTFKQFINERMDNDLFKAVERARGQFKIRFDLENFDSGKDPEKTIDLNGEPLTYRQYWSSGDWETPTVLFVYRINDGKPLVFIPNNEQGNPQLVKHAEKDYLYPMDDQDKIKADPEQCEKSFLAFIKK